MAPEGLAGEESRVCQDLVNLLRFIEKLLAERDVVVFDIDTYPVRLTEADLCGADGTPLPGIAFAPDEGAWLSFARLQERGPPPPPRRIWNRGCELRQGPTLASRRCSWPNA